MTGDHTTPWLEPEGNPEGKGVVPVLRDWQALAPAGVRAKGAAAVLRDYWASSLVLNARFDFRVVPGNTYTLYCIGEGWQLSLISPEEWGERAPGVGVARCCLRTDMTWALDWLPAAREDPAITAVLAPLLEGFLARIRAGSDLEASLPVYEAQLPYGRRMLAAALARSLGHSLELAGLAGRSADAWLETLGGSRLLPDQR